MFKNYFKIIIRNLYKRPLFSVINVTGLALGLSCGIFILLWVSDEMKYDAFHKSGRQLYRVMENQYYADGITQTTQSTPGVLAEALKEEIPEIELASQMTWEVQELITVGEESHKEEGRYVQPDFMEMFTYPLIKGNETSALSKPTSIVISEKMAQRYFGNIDPIGKMVLINNMNEYEITGVLQDIPRSSSIRFEFLLPYEQWLKNNEWAKSWENTGPRTMVLIQEGSRQEVEFKIKDFVKLRLPDPSKGNVELILQPYSEMYLHSEFKSGKSDGGRIDYVKSFSLVAIVVLVIACINFMNLATSQSLKRAKEIGVRKANGAPRMGLITQFLSEAVLFSFIALFIALLIVQLLLPSFRLLTDKEIYLPYADLGFLATLGGITLLTGIIAGSYPAFFLSSFNILSVLKGTLKFNTRSISLRKGLVVFQFCLTILMIFCTLVVYRQMSFIKSKNLGFDRENLILVNLEGNLNQKMETLVQETSKLRGVKSTTVSTTPPLKSGNSTIDVDWPGKLPDEKMLFTQMGVGYDYCKTMGIEVIAGRDFSRDFGSDSAAYVINEETARKMHMEDPVGQTIAFWNRPGKIVGLVKDYHFNSLHNPIEPVILHLHPQWANLMIARIEPGMTTQAVEGLNTLATKLNPSYPFEYHFVDETFEKQYRSETMIGTLANYFSFLAIFISCLGLLGLVIFTAEQRTKEIGLRKVLGASVGDILFLISKDFVVLVIIAFALSTPLAWYVMDSWLHHYAYHISIGWQVFAWAGLVSVCIVMLTISFQSIRAAVANPVDSIRSE